MTAGLTHSPSRLRGLYFMGGILLFWLWMGASAAFGQATNSVEMAWDPSPDPTVTGYALYYGPDSGQYTNRLDVGNLTEGAINGLVEGAIYYIAVVAYDSAGLESGPSNEVIHQVPMPTVPARILLMPTLGGFQTSWEATPGSTYRVYYKDNLSDPVWTEISPEIEATTNRLSWTDTPSEDVMGQRFYTVWRIR